MDQDNKIPSAQEYLRLTRLELDESRELEESETLYDDDIIQMMQEFAELHVRAALESAANDVTHKHKVYDGTFEITEQSILNSYPKENIK